MFCVPLNLAPQAPGEGWGIYDAAGWRVLVMNLIGRCEYGVRSGQPVFGCG